MFSRLLSCLSLPKGSYDETNRFGYSKALAQEIISIIRTDLDAFSNAEACVLENHGYALADAAVKKHAANIVTTPQPLNVPHPEWLDELKVRSALRDSGKVRILGRGWPSRSAPLVIAAMAALTLLLIKSSRHG